MHEFKLLRTRQLRINVCDIFASDAKRHMWIDGQDSAQEGTFRWMTTGEAFSYTHWYQGEPNNVNNEDCAHMMWDGNGGWNDAPCSFGFGAVCEIKCKSVLKI